MSKKLFHRSSNGDDHYIGCYNFCCKLLSSQIIVTSHLTTSLLFTHHNILPHLNGQICNAEFKETALAAYWVIDGVDRYKVGFTSWHLVKHETSLMVDWPK